MADLSWVRPLAGEEGPEILWRALEEAGGVSGVESRLRADGVAKLCSSLVLSDVSTSGSETVEERACRIVWTLPIAHVAHARRGSSYRDAIIELINYSNKLLFIISPFVDSSGMAAILTPLLSAMLRGVQVTLVTHDAINLASFTSRAIEELRREAERVGGNLAVYSAEAGTGRDRQTHPLLHAKIVASDGKKVLIGSANLTSHALASNFEAGVLLGVESAEDVLHTMDDLLKSHFVYLVFSTAN
ncbi:phospholipase D-like domain-containing protein [Tautonia sociabilis]|uniref:phospholipase D-like domain-containing protein n=1 Tax=Tautonia sociabilis TaxID=2080755 RepID=UPI00131573E8|nr:phospholipase D-like domain-containing protein [Tautonia sociabilis]